MKNVFTIVYALFSTVSFAQTKLIGYVTEQNSGKKPVADAQIKSAGANPMTSTSDGKFMLTFQGFKVGQNILVRAEKEGWDLVNEKEMNTFIPADPNEKPLKIILCKAGTLAKAKSKYYETFEENLLIEFTKLKAKHKDKQKEIAHLEEEYSRVQKQLNDLADEYSRINLDDASEKELKAIELFKAGKYDEFIALKNSIVTEEEADNAIKNKQIAAKITANSDSTLALYFKSQKDIAKTQILQLKFKKAEETYQKIVSKDTANFDNIFEFAVFLGKQNSFDKSLIYFQKAMKHSKNKFEKGSIFMNLAFLEGNKNNSNSSYKYIKEFMAIVIEIFKEKPGTIDNETIEFWENKLFEFKKFKDFKKSIIKISKDAFISKIIKYKNEIDILDTYIKNSIDKSEKINFQKQIIDKMIELSQNDEESFLSNDLASNYSNLAWFQIFGGQYIDAEKSAREALNPTAFKKTKDYDVKIEWANTNLALALLFQGKYAEAEKIYIALKDKTYKKTTYREIFLADLEELEKAGITHSDVVKIRELLKK